MFTASFANGSDFNLNQFTTEYFKSPEPQQELTKKPSWWNRFFATKIKNRPQQPSTLSANEIGYLCDYYIFPLFPALYTRLISKNEKEAKKASEELSGIIGFYTKATPPQNGLSLLLQEIKRIKDEPSKAGANTRESHIEEIDMLKSLVACNCEQQTTPLVIRVDAISESCTTSSRFTDLISYINGLGALSKPKIIVLNLENDPSKPALWGIARLTSGKNIEIKIPEHGPQTSKEDWEKSLLDAGWNLTTYSELALDDDNGANEALATYRKFAMDPSCSSKFSARYSNPEKTDQQATQIINEETQLFRLILMELRDFSELKPESLDNFFHYMLEQGRLLGVGCHARNVLALTDAQYTRLCEIIKERDQPVILPVKKLSIEIKNSDMLSEIEWLVNKKDIRGLVYINLHVSSPEIIESLISTLEKLTPNRIIFSFDIPKETSDEQKEKLRGLQEKLNRRENLSLQRYSPPASDKKDDTKTFLNWDSSIQLDSAVVQQQEQQQEQQQQQQQQQQQNRARKNAFKPSRNRQDRIPLDQQAYTRKDLLDLDGFSHYLKNLAPNLVANADLWHAVCGTPILHRKKYQQIVAITESAAQLLLLHRKYFSGGIAYDNLPAGFYFSIAPKLYGEPQQLVLAFDEHRIARDQEKYGRVALSAPVPTQFNPESIKEPISNAVSFLSVTQPNTHADNLLKMLGEHSAIAFDSENLPNAIKQYLEIHGEEAVVNLYNLITRLSVTYSREIAQLFVTGYLVNCPDIHSVFSPPESTALEQLFDGVNPETDRAYSTTEMRWFITSLAEQTKKFGFQPLSISLSSFDQFLFRYRQVLTRAGVSEEAISNLPLPRFQADDVLNLPTYFSRVLHVLENCSEPRRQIAELAHLSLMDPGPYLATRQGYYILSQEMELNNPEYGFLIRNDHDYTIDIERFREIVDKEDDIKEFSNEKTHAIVYYRYLASQLERPDWDICKQVCQKIDKSPLEKKAKLYYLAALGLIDDAIADSDQLINQWLTVLEAAEKAEPSKASQIVEQLYNISSIFAETKQHQLSAEEILLISRYGEIFGVSFVEDKLKTLFQDPLNRQAVTSHIRSALEAYDQAQLIEDDATRENKSKLVKEIVNEQIAGWCEQNFAATIPAEARKDLIALFISMACRPIEQPANSVKGRNNPRTAEFVQRQIKALNDAAANKNGAIIVANLSLALSMLETQPIDLLKQSALSMEQYGWFTEWSQWTTLMPPEQMAVLLKANVPGANFIAPTMRVSNLRDPFDWFCDLRNSGLALQGVRGLALILNRRQPEKKSKTQGEAEEEIKVEQDEDEYKHEAEFDAELVAAEGVEIEEDSTAKQIHRGYLQLSTFIRAMLFPVITLLRSFLTRNNHSALLDPRAEHAVAAKSIRQLVELVNTTILENDSTIEKILHRISLPEKNQEQKLSIAGEFWKLESDTQNAERQAAGLVKPCRMDHLTFDVNGKQEKIISVYELIDGIMWWIMFRPYFDHVAACLLGEKFKNYHKQFNYLKYSLETLFHFPFNKENSPKIVEKDIVNHMTMIKEVITEVVGVVQHLEKHSERLAQQFLTKFADCFGENELNINKFHIEVKNLLTALQEIPLQYCSAELIESILKNMSDYASFQSRLTCLQRIISNKKRNPQVVVAVLEICIANNNNVELVEPLFELFSIFLPNKLSGKDAKKYINELTHHLPTILVKNNPTENISHILLVFKALKSFVPDSGAFITAVLENIENSNSSIDQVLEAFVTLGGALTTDDKQLSLLGDILNKSYEGLNGRNLPDFIVLLGKQLKLVADKNEYLNAILKKDITDENWESVIKPISAIDSNVSYAAEVNPHDHRKLTSEKETNRSIIEKILAVSPIAQKAKDQLLRSCHPVAVYGAIDKHYEMLEAERTVNQSCDTLTKRPLSYKRRKNLLCRMAQVNELGRGYIQHLTQEQLNILLRQCRACIKEENSSAQDKIAARLMAIAITREVMYRTTTPGKFAFSTQIQAIVNLIDDKGDIIPTVEQIKTGEGKTLITGLLALQLWLGNEQVDVCTSDLQLAHDNQQELKLYYRYMGLKSQFVENNPSNPLEIEKSDVRYSDFTAMGLMHAAAREAEIQMGFSGSEKKSVAIVADEVDRGVQQEQKKNNLVTPMPMTAQGESTLAWFYKLLVKTLEENYFAEKKTVNIHQLRDELQQRIPENEILHQEQLAMIKDEDFTVFCKSAMAVLEKQYKLGEHYTVERLVKDKKVRYMIRILGSGGIIDRQSQWGQGFQQCLEAWWCLEYEKAKYGTEYLTPSFLADEYHAEPDEELSLGVGSAFLVSPETRLVYSSSSSTEFMSYSEAVGITGTSPSDPFTLTFQARFGIEQLITLPSHWKPNLTILPSEIISGKDINSQDTSIEDIEEAKWKAMADRLVELLTAAMMNENSELIQNPPSILITTKDPNETRRLFSHLSSQLPSQLQEKLNKFCADTVEGDDQALRECAAGAMQKAGMPAQITIASSFSRGTDIKPENELLVFVVGVDIEENTRQKIGRTNRQANPGTAKVLVRHSEVSDSTVYRDGAVDVEETIRKAQAKLARKIQQPTTAQSILTNYVHQFRHHYHTLALKINGSEYDEKIKLKKYLTSLWQSWLEENQRQVQVVLQELSTTNNPDDVYKKFAEDQRQTFIGLLEKIQVSVPKEQNELREKITSHIRDVKKFKIDSKPLIRHEKSVSSCQGWVTQVTATEASLALSGTPATSEHAVDILDDWLKICSQQYPAHPVYPTDPAPPVYHPADPAHPTKRTDKINQAICKRTDKIDRAIYWLYHFDDLLLKNDENQERILAYSKETQKKLFALFSCDGLSNWEKDRIKKRVRGFFNSTKQQIDQQLTALSQDSRLAQSTVKSRYRQLLNLLASRNQILASYSLASDASNLSTYSLIRQLVKTVIDGYQIGRVSTSRKEILFSLVSAIEKFEAKNVIESINEKIKLIHNTENNKKAFFKARKSRLLARLFQCKTILYLSAPESLTLSERENLYNSEIEQARTMLEDYLKHPDIKKRADLSDYRLEEFNGTPYEKIQKLLTNIETIEGTIYGKGGFLKSPLYINAASKRLLQFCKLQKQLLAEVIKPDLLETKLTSQLQTLLDERTVYQEPMEETLAHVNSCCFAILQDHFDAEYVKIEAVHGPEQKRNGENSIFTLRYQGKDKNECPHPITLKIVLEKGLQIKVVHINPDAAASSKQRGMTVLELPAPKKPPQQQQQPQQPEESGTRRHTR